LILHKDLTISISLKLVAGSSPLTIEFPLHTTYFTLKIEIAITLAIPTHFESYSLQFRHLVVFNVDHHLSIDLKF
jgi:hypothetical protein